MNSVHDKIYVSKLTCSLKMGESEACWREISLFVFDFVARFLETRNLFEAKSIPRATSSPVGSPHPLALSLSVGVGSTYFGKKKHIHRNIIG